MHTDKVWFVTSAGQGMGSILVQKLLDKGYKVVATSCNADTLQKMITNNYTNRFLPMVVDLSNTDSLRNAIQQTIKTFGHMDVFVNNAGYGIFGTHEETNEEAIKKIVEANVRAAININSHIIPLIRRQGFGYVINLSSIAGFLGTPDWSVYSTTKEAMMAFSELLASHM